MLNNNKNGIKTAVDNMGKISHGGIKLFFTAIGLVGSSYVGYHIYTYYNDDARRRANAISHCMLDMLHTKYDSVRVKDVELIRKRLTLKPYEIHNNFSVLIGPRGIGKTVAIQSAAENLNGIISIVSIEKKKRF